MRRANIVSCILVLLLAIYIMVQAVSLEYMIESAPGPGFLPMWTAVFMILIAGILLYSTTFGIKGESTPTPVFKKESISIILTVIGGSVGCMLITYLLGMLVAIGLMIGFLSRALGYKYWRTNISLALLTPVAFWIIFQLGLQVELPSGLLGM